VCAGHADTGTVSLHGVCGACGGGCVRGMRTRGPRPSKGRVEGSAGGFARGKDAEAGVPIN